MKKIILPALFGVMLLASCKKDYTCECTVTEVVTGTEIDYMNGDIQSANSTSTSVYSDKYTKITKKQLQREEQCISVEYSNTYSGKSPFGESWSNTKKVTEDCKIKK